MLSKLKITLWFYFLVLMSTLYGCAYNLPPAAKPNSEAYRIAPSKNMHARVGIYLSADSREYDYKRRLKGMTFRMRVGNSLYAILPQMTSAMMPGDAVTVKSLPPYDDDYRPDVDAVIEPNILYAYGNVTGSVTGHVEARIIMRTTIYSLDGKALWQDTATGVSRSGELDLAGNYLGILEKADRTAYEAAFSAAARITDDFNNARRKGLSITGEIQSPPEPDDNSKYSDIMLFRQYYESGRRQYEKKRFHQALISFEKALDANPADLSTLFYLAVCYTYTGQKNKAIIKFRKFRELTESASEIRDADRWMFLLEKPLRIGIVPPGPVQEERDSILKRVLTDSGMYEVIELPGLKISDADSMNDDFVTFLDECLKKGMRVVILENIDYNAIDAVKAPPDGGDTATDYIVRITARVYSTKKKELKKEITIDERETFIREETGAEEPAIKERLLQRGGKELLLRLLENDIF